MKSNIFIEFSLFFMLFLLPKQIFSQKLDSVPIYHVINSYFITVLDSFIINEKQYEYYTTNVTFFINIMDSTGTIFELNSGVLFNKVPILYNYRKKNAGVFFYKEHSFILSGRSIISNKIMKKTDHYQTVEFIDIKDSDNDVIEDDSYFPTTWLCKLRKNNVVILSKTPMRKYH